MKASSRAAMRQMAKSSRQSQKRIYSLIDDPNIERLSCGDPVWHLDNACESDCECGNCPLVCTLCGAYVQPLD